MTHRLADEPMSRRTLAGLTAAGLSLPVLAACAEDPDRRDDAARSGDLGTTSEIEVGGGTIFPEQGVVVTQPTDGDFKAFDATCTHQGCQVGEVSGGTINCPCHGSRFSIEDGSPQSGPATSPLEEVPIRVNGDRLEVGEG